MNCGHKLGELITQGTSQGIYNLFTGVLCLRVLFAFALLQENAGNDDDDSDSGSGGLMQPVN